MNEGNINLFNYYPGIPYFKKEEYARKALEILSYDLLDFATDKLGAEYLSVRKTNTVAIHVYKERGFKTFKESDSMYFMMK